MDNQEDETIAPRDGLDSAKLSAYLRPHLALSGGPLVVRQFPGGSSNLTYLLTAGDDDYILRRPPFGNTVKTAHDMRREFDVLSKLAVVYAPAPKPLHFCDDIDIIGSEFYLMERRRGLVIRGEIPGTQPLIHGEDAFPTGRVTSTAICRSFIQNLAELHSLEYRAAGLADLGKPDGYDRRQVEGWTKRYYAAKTHKWPDLEKAIVWLNNNVPPESGASLIHNDYKFDNVMLDPVDLTRITAVLDWEMVTIGDPLMDLGTTLGYWMSADTGVELLNMPFNPLVLMENISRQELVEMYAEASGRDVTNILFYYVFGTFKIAVIAQQIYARYVKGFAKDERFAAFDKFVATLGSIANASVIRSSI